LNRRQNPILFQQYRNTGYTAGTGKNEISPRISKPYPCEF
jgi:hypothetical protein